jgi:hypothetical protein
MGLLDGLLGSSLDDPRTAATLQLAQGLLSGNKALPAISGGLLGYTQSMQNSKRQQQAEEYRKLQMQQQAMQIAQAQRQAQRQNQLDALPAQFMRSPVQVATGIGGGPTPQAAEALKTAEPSFDFGGYAKALAGVDPLASLQLQQSLRKERPKFSTAVQYDQNGRAFVQAEDGSTRYLDGVKARDKLIAEDVGGKKIFRTEYSADPLAEVRKTMTPGEAASNAVGWANVGVARDRLKLDQESAGGVTYQTDGTGQIVALPKRPNMAGSITAMPVQGQASQGKKDANEALAIINEAKKYLGDATGSGVGAATDAALGFFGKSTDGAKATAQLQALSGALVAKMPKMSGPQSDKDVLLYKQMAADIGNPWTPNEQRQAALAVVEGLQRKYAGLEPMSSGGASAPIPGLKFLGFEGQ